MASWQASRISASVAEVNSCTMISGGLSPGLAPRRAGLCRSSLRQASESDFDLLRLPKAALACQRPTRLDETASRSLHSAPAPASLRGAGILPACVDRRQDACPTKTAGCKPAPRRQTWKETRSGTPDTAYYSLKGEILPSPRLVIRFQCQGRRLRGGPFSHEVTEYDETIVRRSRSAPVGRPARHRRDPVGPSGTAAHRDDARHSEGVDLLPRHCQGRAARRRQHRVEGEADRARATPRTRTDRPAHPRGVSPLLRGLPAAAGPRRWPRPSRLRLRLP